MGVAQTWWPWGVGVVSGPFRAPNRFVGFWVVLVNGPNTVCGVLPPGTPSKGRATTACWGGTRLPDCPGCGGSGRPFRWGLGSVVWSRRRAT